MTEPDSIVTSPDIIRPDRIPPGQRVVEKWPVLHYGDVPTIDPSDWTLTIWGLVERERRLTYEESRSLPQVKILSDVHCVTTWSLLDNVWEGVSTRVIDELAGVRDEARFVIVHAHGDFTTNLAVEDFFRRDVLLATRHNGEALTPAHGYPVRLVVPGLYFWKSAKWVTGIEFSAEDRPGFWESRGYHNHGDPWKEERYG